MMPVSPSATFSATLGYGGYAGFSFGELTKISSFTAELPENTRLEYSPNGCDWTTFTEDMDNMDVTYVRIVNGINDTARSRKLRDQCRRHVQT